ncbi:MAG TPA: N-acetylmuramoyl-L-alanine amidase [Candidatus Faecousia gallistercoris]|mgnify:FL=1|nr:N-acetylmuramoyl-L-alanine amidase [Candidatus Faecousia gallistercoris]
MKLYQQIAVRNDCYTRNQAELAKAPANRDSRYAQYYRGPRGIMVHSTGANNPNLRRYVQPDDGVLGVNSNQNDWNRPGLEVCVHAFLGLTQAGEVAAYQILPWEYRAWHCGGDANNTHLSFEICEDNLRDRAYWEKTYRLARELTAELCRKFGLDPLAPGVLVDHAEGAALGIASNHADVDHWWSRYGVTMDDFRADVARLLEQEDAAQEEEEEPSMTREEITQLVKQDLEEERDARIFRNLADVPDWAAATAQKLVERGALQGDGKALNLSYDLLRTMVALDRLGILDA